MYLQNIKIRESNESELQYVFDVEQQAFGSEKEAELVNNLLHDKTAQPAVSLLAFNGNEAIGHILFTRAFINDSVAKPSSYILAPLAVIPKYQKKGIGGMLIKEGLKRLKEMGVELVFVLGHINYYPRHGFINNAGSLGYPAPYPIPEEVADAWMVQSLKSGILSNYSGKVYCAEAMDKPEYWRE